MEKPETENLDYGAVGNWSSIELGYMGYAIAKKCGIAKCGDWGIAAAGYLGEAVGGSESIAVVHGSGSAEAESAGWAICNHFGSVSSGMRGLSLGTGDSKFKSGDGGILLAVYWEGTRNRVLVGYVGEEIKANVWYEVKNGKFVETSPPLPMEEVREDFKRKYPYDASLKQISVKGGVR